MSKFIKLPFLITHPKMKKSLFLSIFCCFLSLACISQKNKSQAENSDFPSQELFTHLKLSINKYRLEHGLDSLESNDLLVRVAEMSSKAMAKEGKAVPDAGGKTPGQKLFKMGGSKKADEVEASVVPSKGKKQFSSKEMSDQITAKWFKDKRMKVALLQPQWTYFGFSVAPDKEHKNYYVSCMLGGFDIDNAGAKKRKELTVRYNKRSKKLSGPDPKICKSCDAWKDFEKLRNGLKVENGKIYLEYDNIKYLKKILKKESDGFAVDVVQYAQYSKSEYNIVDNNLLNKGVMQKVVFRDKIFAKNEIKPDPKAKKNQKSNAIKIQLGKFPKGIKEQYELNLIVVQEGKICKTILRSYDEKGSQESNTPLEMLPEPLAEASKIPAFEPRSETAILNFVVPFERGKSEFKPEDIKPLLDALQEPEFKIEGLYIYAYSSIEGDSATNSKLQTSRAQSIAKVLHKLNNTQVEPLIKTNDSWLLFQMEVEDGKYDTLSKMGKKKAIQKINSDPQLMEELEPILARERFAQIVMDVTYDISGPKEEKFCFIKFNQAVKQGNLKQAMKIMDYIHKKVNSGAYTKETWEKLEIPFEKKNVSLLMTKKYLEYISKGKSVDEQDVLEISKISNLDPSENIAKYNMLFCKLKVDTTIGDDAAQAAVQNSIDVMYKSNIPKKVVDALNAEWNFKQMDYYDTIEGMEPKVEACVQRIKKFYDFKGSSWQNALKLSYVFARSKEYEFAANLLEPFLKGNEVDENLLFDYISIASHLPSKFFSRNFSGALALAKEKNQERYCKLFGDPYMSFQVLDNPNVKKVYVEAGCGK